MKVCSLHNDKDGLFQCASTSHFPILVWIYSQEHLITRPQIVEVRPLQNDEDFAPAVEEFVRAAKNGDLEQLKKCRESLPYLKRPDGRSPVDMIPKSGSDTQGLTALALAVEGNHFEIVEVSMPPI